MSTMGTISTVAAVDCGTNSIRLLIQDSESQAEIARRNTIVRLGQGVDETGVLSAAAIERTRAALEAYVAEMQDAGVARVRMVATSATRDAANRNEFFDMTAELLGRIQPGAVAEVITGTEEAALSFAGATTDVPAEVRARGPLCVVDLGGGSTEFVVEDSDGVHAVSTQMGCVRVTERIMRSDPPTDQEQEDARSYVRGRIDQAQRAVPLDRVATFVGCAGTFTTLSALAQELDSYDPTAIHMSHIGFARLREVTSALRCQTAAQRAQHPVMDPGRADVIGAGAVIVEELMAAFEQAAGAHAFYISEKDILDGIAAGLA